MSEKITVQSFIKAPIEKVWTYWTSPEHITKWCFASDDWCAPRATNDIRTGGVFSTRMEAKDGSVGFDFGGKYELVKENELIEYAMEDGRKVKIEFIKENKEGIDGCTVIETFDPEHENPAEMQRAGWQAILDNFKKHVENE